MGEGYRRADLQRLMEVFSKYASVTEGGEKFLTYEDFVVRFLKLLPEKDYNKETLALFGGILDQVLCISSYNMFACFDINILYQGKDGAELISFNEFVAFEAHLCKPDALYRAAFQLFDRQGKNLVSFCPKVNSFIGKERYRRFVAK